MELSSRLGYRPLAPGAYTQRRVRPHRVVRRRFPVGHRQLNLPEHGYNLIDGIQKMTGEPLTLASPDKTFLHAQVKRLLDLVSYPPSLDSALRAADSSGRFNVSAPVRQAIPLKISLLKRTGDDEYKWIYNRYGIHNQAGDITIIVNNQELWESSEMLDRFSQSFGEALILIEVDRTEQWDAALRRVEEKRIQRSLQVPLGLIMSRPPGNANVPSEYRFTVAPLDAVAACNETFLAAPTKYSNQSK